MRDLQMDPHRVRAERFHLRKILRDRVPFRVPILFQQPARAVVIVIAAPGSEPPTRTCRDEVPPILADAD